MALGIVQQGLSSMFAPPPSGPSPEEVARKKAEEEAARRQAEEAARIRAEEEARRQAAEKARRLQIAGLMKGADGNAPLPGGGRSGSLSWKGLDDAPAASPGFAQGAGGPAGRTAFDRLRCARAFSSAADQYRGLPGADAAEKARFFALQSQKALSGEPLDAECPAASLPDVPMPAGIEAVFPGEGTREELVERAKADFGLLESVRERKRALSERKAAAESRRKEAETRLATPAEPAPAASPGPDGERLKAEAEALLRETEDELAGIGRDERSLDAEEKRLGENLGRYEAKMRALEAQGSAGTSK
jgi:hypothetical protein